jgi:hypothetical protein
MALQGKNGNIAKSKLWSLRFLLLVVSLLLTLCLLEVALKSLYPKYQYAASGEELNTKLIEGRPPGHPSIMVRNIT